MEKVGVSDLLDYQIDRLIVVCKTVQKRKREGIEISLKISLQECPSDFSEQVEEELVLSSQTGGKKFIETLLRERLKGEWITGFTQGTNLLLPPSFRRFYK